MAVQTYVVEDYPFPYTDVFVWNRQAVEQDYFIIINQGGSSSSKTVSILESLILDLLSAPRQVATVVGEDIPALKAGAIRDFEMLKSESEFIRKMCPEFNKGDLFATLANGSIIEFNSYQGFQDAKHGKRDYLLLNEANSIKEEITKELIMRTRKRVYIDFNANEAFYVHERYMDREDSITIYSNFMDNKFCPDRTKEELLSYKKRNWNDWLVYGLGKTGSPTNKKPFFTDFNINKHVVADYELDPNQVVLQSYDFNYNPATCLLIQMIAGEGIFIAKEFQQNGGTKALLDRHMSPYVGKYMYAITGDNSGHHAHSSAELTDWQIIESFMNSAVSGKTKEANKRHIYSRKLINHAFWKDTIYISQKGCPKLIAEIQSAEQTPTGRLLKDDDKHRNDLVDAFRYGIHWLFDESSDVDNFVLQRQELLDDNIALAKHRKKEAARIEKRRESTQPFKIKKK